MLHGDWFPELEVLCPPPPRFSAPVYYCTRTNIFRTRRLVFEPIPNVWTIIDANKQINCPYIDTRCQMLSIRVSLLVGWRYCRLQAGIQLPEGEEIC